MPEKMKQRKGPIKCEFDLRDESFVYSFEDKDGATVVEVDYTLLLNNPYSRTYKNQWMMNVGFLWLAMSTAGRIYEHSHQSRRYTLRFAGWNSGSLGILLKGKRICF